MSRQVLQVKGYTPEQIKSLFNQDEKYQIGIKLYAIYQVSKGQARRRLEELYNTSFKQICNWVHRFEKEGIQGLKHKPKSGKPSLLSIEKKAELKNILENKKPVDFGYNTSTWNGPILIDFIKNTYGISYKKAQIYNILKALGFTYQKGRAKYPEADEQKREEFKKRYKKTSGRT
jgi:transposase